MNVRPVTGDVLDVDFPDRGTVRCRLRGYLAPGRYRHEFHLAHAAVLRLEQAFEILGPDDLRVTEHGRDRDDLLSISLEFCVDGVWHDLAACLIQEGWGIEDDDSWAALPEFDPSNYPINQARAPRNVATS